jgi:hypothetical protein
MNGLLLAAYKAAEAEAAHLRKVVSAQWDTAERARYEARLKVADAKADMAWRLACSSEVA